jgi:hypothetical protein
MLELARPLLLISVMSLVVACGAPTDSWTNDPEPAATDTGMAKPDDDTGSVPSTDTATAPVEDTAIADSATMDTAIDSAPDAPAGCVLPPRDCTGTPTYCAELVPFEPITGPGYDNYPLNGETLSNQYRSYCRRDLMILVKYAAAYVECKAKTWTGGNGAPIGLGDMSEKNGAIPGTSIGSPGHPAGTHTNGYDMDIGYYQTTGTNNYLRPVCPHTSGGVDQYHCTGAPTILDVKRTALFLGAFLLSDRTRIIGVDGKIGPLVVPAMQALCDDGSLPKLSCDRKTMIAYETTDTGRGWYKFHHHHFHVSLKKVTADWSDGPMEMFSPADLERLEIGHVLGHAHVE